MHDQRKSVQFASHCIVDTRRVRSMCVCRVCDNIFFMHKTDCYCQHRIIIQGIVRMQSHKSGACCAVCCEGEEEKCQVQMRWREESARDRLALARCGGSWPKKKLAMLLHRQKELAGRVHAGRRDAGQREFIAVRPFLYCNFQNCTHSRIAVWLHYPTYIHIHSILRSYCATSNIPSQPATTNDCCCRV